MSLRQLPQARVFERPQNFQSEMPADVLARWSDKPLAAEADEPNTISIYDVIGEDFWSGGGFTAKRMAGALRDIGNNAVNVKLNSPGGDMFEGIAIYNLLREHPARVTVDVMGWAASAASIIAMAGDEIRMGLGTFMMVHNAWGMVVGNRHDLSDAAKLFETFDGAIADIYEARTGMKRAAIVDLMDAETFMGPSDAVKNGFADSIAEGLKASPAESNNSGARQVFARRKTEAALAKAGYSRSMRSEMLSELLTAVAPRDASDRTAARDAGIDVTALQGLLASMKSR